MAKKSFSTNVAEAWFTTDIQPQKKEQPKQTEKAKTESVKKTSAPKEIEQEEETEIEEEVFEEEEKKPSRKTKQKAEAKFVLTPTRELKSRRTSVLLKTSIYDKISELAKGNNTSFNDCLNQILEQVLPE